jgi:hypothetical protein
MSSLRDSDSDSSGASVIPPHPPGWYTTPGYGWKRLTTPEIEAMTRDTVTTSLDIRPHPRSVVPPTREDEAERYEEAREEYQEEEEEEEEGMYSSHLRLLHDCVVSEFHTNDSQRKKKAVHLDLQYQLQHKPPNVNDEQPFMPKDMRRSGNNLHLRPPVARPGLSQSSTSSLRPKVALPVLLAPSSSVLPLRELRLHLARSLHPVEPNVNALLLLLPRSTRTRMRMKKWLMHQVVPGLLLQLLRSRSTVNVELRWLIVMMR